MKLFYCGISAILLAIAIESGVAIECWQCMGQKGIPGSPDVQLSCFDPVNTTTEFVKVECQGSCFANASSTTASVQGNSFTISTVQRGCQQVSAECMPTICADQNTAEGTARLCNYCCEDQLCNKAGIEETVASLPTINCWNCMAELTESDPPSGSCASDDFSGEGAQQMTCTGQCIILQQPANEQQGAPAQFMRSCDVQGMCALEAPGPGFKKKCCEEDMCNVGEIDDDDDEEEPKEGTIKCWRCDGEVTNGTAANSTCYLGMFPADGITKVDCPSGKCIKYTYVGQGTQAFSRSCATPEMDSFCNADDTADFKDVKCCTKNLCNKESSACGIATSVATILSALLVSVYLGAM